MNFRFSDHLGRAEEEIKREVENLGGSHNGLTYWDHTFYSVSLGKQHGLFALDWLFRIVSPHDMPPEIVQKQREPVAIEVGSLNAITPEDLRSFYNNYYVPSVMTLIVGGDFEKEALLKALNRSFATLPERPITQRINFVEDAIV